MGLSAFRYIAEIEDFEARLAASNKDSEALHLQLRRAHAGVVAAERVGVHLQRDLHRIRSTPRLAQPRAMRPEGHDGAAIKLARGIKTSI